MAQKEVAVSKGPSKDAMSAKSANVKLEEGEVEEKVATKAATNGAVGDTAIKTEVKPTPSDAAAAPTQASAL